MRFVYPATPSIYFDQPLPGQLAAINRPLNPHSSPLVISPTPSMAMQPVTHAKIYELFAEPVIYEALVSEP